MLTCRETEELLDLYLDQELDPRKRENCEQHLRQCSHCRMLLQLRKQETEVIKNSFPVPELTPDFSRKVMAEISLNNKPQSRGILSRILSGRRSWMVPVIAASLLIFVISGLSSSDILTTSERDGAQEGASEIRGTQEPYIDFGRTEQQKQLTPLADTKALSNDESSISSGEDGIPDFTPGYLPAGFVQEGVSVPGSQRGDEADHTKQPIVFSYHNPQTGGYINLEISKADSAAEPSTGREQGITRSAEKEGQHYLLTITGNIPLEELKKVADSLR